MRQGKFHKTDEMFCNGCFMCLALHLHLLNDLFVPTMIEVVFKQLSVYNSLHIYLLFTPNNKLIVEVDVVASD